LKDDDYAEYSDRQFIARLGVTLGKVSLESFWPKRGPVWDGLAKTNSGRLILVEAKAHIAELVSTPARAREPSLSKIRRSLDATRQFLRSGSKADWTTSFYQYTNRLAHLYLLRELNGLQAYLLFLCFVNDKDIGGPTTKLEWEAAIKLLELSLGVRSRKLSRYVRHVFIDVKKLKSPVA